MRCPVCGEMFSVRDAMMDAEWKEILVDVAPMFGPHAKLVFEYVELFGVNPLRTRPKKILRLMKEVSRLFTSGRFGYQKKTYTISQPGVVAALSIVCNKEFDRPLTNHNYLKQVMIQQAKDELKQMREAQERAQREREARGSGFKVQGSGTDGEMSIEEFKKESGRDIGSLAAMIGKRM